MRNLPRIQSKQTAVVAGVAAFCVGWYCFHEAYEGRGGETPWWLRPFSWW